MKPWTASDMPSQKGKRIIVTGVGGLGFDTSLVLARAGAEVILAGRNAAKGASAIRRIQANCLDAKTRFELLDLASLASIADFAQRITDANDSIDTLINNAGVMAVNPRRITADGFELQFGTNHLGHFALTARLLPLLRRATSPRVVTLASSASRIGKIHFNDLQFENSYQSFQAYAQSKLANLMFAIELQRRSDANNWRVTSSAAHPGYARTDLITNGPGRNILFDAFEPLVSQNSADGALPTLFAATAPEAAGGGYFGPRGFFEMKGPPGPAHIPRAALNLQNAERLWEESEKLTGVSFHAS